MAPRMIPSILNWAEASIGASSTRPPTNANPATVQIEDLLKACIAVSRSEPAALFFPGFWPRILPDESVFSNQSDGAPVDQTRHRHNKKTAGICDLRVGRRTV